MNKAIIIILLAVLTGCFPRGRDYGEELYSKHCSNCHGIEGNGLHQLYPPIKNSDYLISHQEELGCIIRYGMEKPIVVNGVSYKDVMPSQPMLTEVEIANLINYISENIEPQVKNISIDDAETLLTNCSVKKFSE